MPAIAVSIRLVLAIAAAASLYQLYATGTKARVPHCVAESPRELLVRVEEAKQLPSAGAKDRQMRLRLEAEVLRDTAPRCADLTGRRLRLSWYSPPPVEVGEVWRVQAKVRPPWGYQNPGGFDYERWLMGRGINGTGYIRSGQRHSQAPPDRRRRLHLMVAEQTAALRHPAHLRALAVGDSAGLTEEDWALLRRTGTVHLLVVSGLHVGLVAMLGYFVGAGAVRLAPTLLLRVPAGWVAAAFSLAVIAAFVWLCGAGVPALRAGIMGVFGVLALAYGRRTPVWSWFLLAAVLVICLNPGSVLTQGFWLSFGAVAALIAGFAGRFPTAGWVAGLVRAQLLMLFAMTPLMAIAVGKVTPITGLSNLLAVPWVSLVAVPLVMFSLCASILGLPFASFVWGLADWSLTALLTGLEALDVGVPSLTPVALWQGIASILAFACGLAAPDWRARLACLPLWLVGLVVLYERPAASEVRIIGLDVGQGSAVLVDTRRHRLLFDAGASTTSGFNLGEAVVLPAIAATGPLRLDRLMVSHGDSDHAGGAAAVLAGAPTASVIANTPALNGAPCARGRRWSWDGVEFEVLHPPEDDWVDDNDGSCVLQLTAGGQRVLLTGDISRRAERLLVDSGIKPATLLFAPHHGSNTSSSQRFIEAVNPALVFVSAGWRNSYGHPHPAVLHRYRMAGAKLWVTGVEGALFWSSARPGQVRALRPALGTSLAWWINQPPPLAAANR